MVAALRFGLVATQEDVPFDLVYVYGAHTFGAVQHFLSRGDDVLVLTPKDEYTEQVRSWGVKWIETPLNGTGVNRSLKEKRSNRSILEGEPPLFLALRLSRKSLDGSNFLRKDWILR